MKKLLLLLILCSVPALAQLEEMRIDMAEGQDANISIIDIGRLAISEDQTNFTVHMAGGGSLDFLISDINRITFFPPQLDMELYVNKTGGEVETLTTRDLVITFDDGTPVEEMEKLPGEMSFTNIYPNPFSESSEIQFELEKGGQAEIYIYNSFGDAVANLSSGYLEAGSHSVNWGGQLDSGSKAAAGAYYCVIKKGGLTIAKKIVLIK